MMVKTLNQRHRSFTYILVFTLCALLLTGAARHAAAQPLIGSGQLEFTGAMWKGWLKYKNLFAPEAFAVNPRTGGWSYRYCPDTGQCSIDSYDQVIRDCEKISGAGCKVFARNKQILWNGLVCYNGQPIHGSGNCSKTVRSIDDGRPRMSVPAPDLCEQDQWKGTPHCADKIRPKSPAAPNATAPSGEEATDRVRARLEMLDRLLKDGLISKEEAAAKRKDILRDL